MPKKLTDRKPITRADFKLNLKMDPQLHQEFKGECSYIGTSLSRQVEELVQVWLKKQKQKRFKEYMSKQQMDA